jgi:hypothetical protein
MKKICSYLMRQNQTQRTQPLSCCNGLLSSPLFEKKANLKRKPSLIRSSLLKLINSFGESDFWSHQEQLPKAYFFFHNFQGDEFWKNTQKTFQNLVVFGEVIDLIMNFQNWWAMMGVSFFCYLKKRKYLLQILKSSSVVGFDVRRGEKRRERSNEARDGFLSSWGGW